MKKRNLILLGVVFVVLGCISIFFLTTQKDVLPASYAAGEALYLTGEDHVPAQYYIVDDSFELYCQHKPTSAHYLLGEMKPYTLTRSELMDYTGADRCWVGEKIFAEVTDSYILRLKDDYFYLLFQTLSGKTYLGYGWEDISERWDGASDDTGLFFLCRLDRITPESKPYTSDKIDFRSWKYAPVNKFILTNLHNGRTTVVSDDTEPDAVYNIIEFMRTVRGNHAHSAKGYYEGSYAVECYANDKLLYSMAFGDSPSIYFGEYGDGYPCRFDLEEKTIEEVIDFFSQYDESGMNWNP